MTELIVNVFGAPVQQGSKTAGVTKDGKPYLRDSNDKQLRPWRKDVVETVVRAMTTDGWTTLDAPAEVDITFHLPRPAAHFGTGRNAGVLKDSAPPWKSSQPDIDKLTRAVLDALTTSQAIRDDARVARLVVEKRYANGPTGARITVRPLNVSPADSGSPAAAPSAGEAQEVLFP